MKGKNNNMKLIAMYLPQFHRIKENDKWWGEGYTEWTAVKSADCFFEGHYQPRIPLNNNYYDLLEKSTMEWQAYLMEKYGVFGLCFYHYYFGKGRKLLETPAENLLSWNKIKINYCFSWANETWARTWSKLNKKNTWNSIKEKTKGGDGILIRQEYGGEEEWREHFEYVVPFFRDERYIKYKNMPLFIIHNPEDIHCLNDMCKKWNEWGKKSGFEGIYFITRNYSYRNVNASLYLEPNYSDLFFPGRRKSYDDITKLIIGNAAISRKDAYLCVTPGYDDTPRRGQYGEVIYNSSPEKFYEQIRCAMHISKKNNKEFLFLNAWNEWGEGMYVEPDSKFGYGYLESIKKAITNDYEEKELVDIYEREYESIKKLADSQKNIILKYKWNMNILNSMLCLKERNLSVADILKRRGIKNVAIYGFGIVGKRLLEDIMQSDLIITCIIDKDVEDDINGIKIVKTINDSITSDIIISTFFEENIDLNTNELVTSIETLLM